jgi:hypothetical protein
MGFVTAPGRVYIAGPMTGLPSFNYPKFHAQAKLLRGLGYEVVSPAELHELSTPEEGRWVEYMKIALAALLSCDSIYCLNDWSHSRGAKLEWQVAQALGLAMFYEGDFK